MADSLSTTIDRLTTTAQILVNEEPDPFEAARDLNQAATNAGITDGMLGGSPSQIVLDLMNLPHMGDHLLSQSQRGRGLPSKAEIGQIEDLAELRLVLSI